MSNHALWTATDDVGTVMAITVDDGVLAVQVGSGSTWRVSDPQTTQALRAKLGAAMARQLNDRGDRWPTT
jgi:hypothetical protein